MIVGRKRETELLKKAFEDNTSHFIAVYGRRRIGKTFLIRETFGYRFTFQHTGLSDASFKEQLFAFDASLKDVGLPIKVRSKNWLEAFEKLKELIRQSTEKRKVIFIDELSWMDTKRSDFITALENFWNGWASARKDIVLIVCTSATSWMISNIIHNKGGLYNRLTEQIALRPFTLRECEEYAVKKGLILNRKQILQCYMILGGVPYYWGFLEKGMSPEQNIDRMMFSKNAPLVQEYRYLYASIFQNPDVYINIIKALGQKKIGMTREEIIDSTKIVNSGDLTKKLEELENCGFIRKYYSFGRKKKNAVYQLMDYFTLYYLKFMIQEPSDEHFWTNSINMPSVNAWSGLAFERVCLDHTVQIKKKLGISGIMSEVSAWYCRKDAEKGVFGSQIDLLIVRKDQIINLCEMKYADTEYTITKKDTVSLQRKISDLKTVTKTKYAVHPVLVTSFGLVENAYSGIMQAVITIDDLFE